MFILECMPQDADLFFDIIDGRNSALKSYFTRQEQKYNSTIVCAIGHQNKVPTFRQIDIKDCVHKFSKLSKCLVYRVISQNSFFIMSQMTWLSEDLALFATHGESFVKDVQFKWEEQHLRSKAKLLLTITG